MSYKFTEFIIEQIRSYPILYDISHPDHKNINKKDTVFDEIGLHINETGDEIKKRWKNLRDTFVRYLKGKKPKAGLAGKMQKKYQWADNLEFLRPFLGIESNILSASGIKEELDLPTEDEDVTEASMSSELTLSPPSPLAPTAPARAVRKRKRPSGEASRQQPSTLQAVINYFENKRKRFDKDATDMLFLSYASLMKTFSFGRQITVKLKMAELFAEQEHLHIQEQNTSMLQNSV